MLLFATIRTDGGGGIYTSRSFFSTTAIGAVTAAIDLAGEPPPPTAGVRGGIHTYIHSLSRVLPGWDSEWDDLARMRESTVENKPISLVITTAASLPVTARHQTP